jgi:hypothetical protein
MWSEPTHGEEPVWRGSIDNVADRRRFYFANIGAMCEFMLTERERKLPAAPEANPPGEDGL